MRYTLATAALFSGFCFNAFAEQVSYTLNADLNGQPATVTVAFDNAHPSLVQNQQGSDVMYTIPEASLNIQSGNVNFSTQGVQIRYSSFNWGGYLEFENNSPSFDYSIRTSFMQSVLPFNPLLGSTHSAPIEHGVVRLSDHSAAQYLDGSFTPHAAKTLNVAYGAEAPAPTGNDQLIITGEVRGNALTFTLDYDPDSPNITTVDMGYAVNYTMPQASLKIEGANYTHTVEGAVVSYSSHGNLSIDTLPTYSHGSVNLNINSAYNNFSIFHPINGQGGTADIGASSINVSIPAGNISEYGNFEPHRPATLTKRTASTDCSQLTGYTYSISSRMDGRPFDFTLKYDSTSQIQTSGQPGWETLTIPDAKISLTNGVQSYTTTGAVIRYSQFNNGSVLRFEAIQQPQSPLNLIDISTSYMWSDYRNSDPRIAEGVSNPGRNGNVYLYLNEPAWYTNSFLPSYKFEKTVNNLGGCQ